VGGLSEAQLVALGLVDQPVEEAARQDDVVIEQQEPVELLDRVAPRAAD
jgi:hypothetical protein